MPEAAPVTDAPPPRRLAALDHLDLGRETAYPARYDPALLKAVPRPLNRAELGLAPDTPPFPALRAARQ